MAESLHDRTGGTAGCDQVLWRGVTKIDNALSQQRIDAECEHPYDANTWSMCRRMSAAIRRRCDRKRNELPIEHVVHRIGQFELDRMWPRSKTLNDDRFIGHMIPVPRRVIHGHM